MRVQRIPTLMQAISMAITRVLSLLEAVSIPSGPMGGSMERLTPTPGSYSVKRSLLPQLRYKHTSGGNCIGREDESCISSSLPIPQDELRLCILWSDFGDSPA